MAAEPLPCGLLVNITRSILLVGAKIPKGSFKLVLTAAVQVPLVPFQIGQLGFGKTPVWPEQLWYGQSWQLTGRYLKLCERNLFPEGAGRRGADKEEVIRS